MDSDLNLLAFMDAFHRITLEFVSMGKKTKRGREFPSNEVLLRSANSLSDKIVKSNRLVMLCKIAYSGIHERILTGIATGLFEELLYKAPIEKGFERLNVLVSSMADMILHGQLLEADRIFMGIMWYYSLPVQIPEYVHNFYRRLQYGYWGIASQLTAWGITEVNRFVDLAFWIDSIIDESAGLLDKMQVFQGMSVPLSREVFISVTYLSNQDLRRFSIRFLALRAKPLWGIFEPLQARIAELKERYSDSDLYRQVGALVVHPGFRGKMEFALRVEMQSHISLEDIGWAFVHDDFFKLRELIEAQHDAFSNRGTKTEILAKELLALNAERRGGKSVKLVVGGRYRYFLFVPSALSDQLEVLAHLDPITRELYLMSLIGIPLYREMNIDILERTGSCIVGRIETAYMISYMILPNGFPIPWGQDEFYFSVQGMILNSDTIPDIFRKWGDLIKRDMKGTLHPGGGDLLVVSEENDMFKYLGLKYVRLRPEGDHICIEIALDNSIARFVVDFNWRIFIQGELDSRTTIERGARLEDVSTPFGAYLWGMLILTAIYEILSENYRKGTRSRSRGKGKGEKGGITGTARRGHVRDLGDKHFTQEQYQIVLDLLDIDIEALSRALDKNITFVLPVIPDEEDKEMKPVIHRYKA